MIEIQTDAPKFHYSINILITVLSYNYQYYTANTLIGQNGID